MKCRFDLDIVVCQSSTIFELFSSENESLLVRRDSLFILHVLLYVFDRIRGFDLQRNYLAFGTSMKRKESSGS